MTATHLAETFVRNITIRDHSQLGTKKHDTAEARATRTFDAAEAEGEEFYAAFYAEVKNLCGQN